MFGFFRRIKSALTSGPATEDASADLQTPSDDSAKAIAQSPLKEAADSRQSVSIDAPLGLGDMPAALDDMPAALGDMPAALGDMPAALSNAPAAAKSSGETQLETPERIGWFARLKGGLSKTRSKLAELFGVVSIDEQLLDDLEIALIQADAGVAATESLIAELRQTIKQEKLKDGEAVRLSLRDLIRDRLTPLEGGIDLDRSTPLVLMIAGVNGAGKTTSIGKLARHVQREGKSVLLAAGDTFRAAAREQLAIWGQRNGVEVIAQEGGDPAAVAFDAVSAGRARRSGVVMIDTAGRLPTQSHLMEELRKIRRVIGKAMSDAPHEVLLILDGNTGQNMLHQVKAFDEAISLTGLVVTKLDGTAKGGALLALAHHLKHRPIPVYFIGVGEGLDDLQAFRAEEFANALLDC